MPKQISKRKSPRHGIPYDKIPADRGVIFRFEVVTFTPEVYGQILDCVYEMTDQVSNANGVTLKAAMQTVLKDEGWSILPTHQRLIRTLLIRGSYGQKTV